ncbi:MAG TPA: hypothetical protein RMH99_30225 [Sandaracinaceae bacterium LLY-WYZ-13_1]|nr:hypothetical protein [Sandaracinaceae bacterium LLY-WYZ-13_1]
MRRECLTIIGALLALGCTDTPTGDLTITLEAEETIPEGLTAGTGDENIVDGWNVTFDKYVVMVGDVHLEREAEGIEAHDETVWAVDLAAIPATGITLASFEAIDAVRWDHFEYATPHPDGATRHESVSEADFDEMVANDWTYLIEGTLEKADGESCPPGGACRDATSLTFRFGVPVDAAFGPCEAEDGLSGVTVTEEGTSAAVTIHGDHMFFDAFPSGAEVIERRAQWLANADTDGDDAITAEELTGIDAADLFPSELYNVSGSPYPVEDGFDYLRGQLATQGHFQGEGECPWTVDGAMGGHDHD